MAYTLDNFVRAVLSADATAGANTLLVAKAVAPLRDPPVASVEAPGVLVLQDLPTSPTKVEIVRYTGQSIAGNVVTLTGVTRGQEGTTAQAWSAGTPTFQGVTAGALADLQSALAAKQDAAALGTAAFTDADAYAAAVHQHAISDVNGLQGELDDRPVQTSVAAQISAAIDDLINGAPGALDQLNELAAAMGNDANFAATVTNALAGKAPTVHTHTIANVTGLQSALDVKVPALLDGDWLSAPISNLTANQIYPGDTYAFTAPGSYVNVVSFPTSTNQGRIALAAAFSPTQSFWLRSLGDGAGAQYTRWKPWVEVYHSGNQPRIYVQAADPGAVADGSLWAW